ncbi:MAG: universal stress protein [Candidatus Limnocylindrales bacterium]
MSEQRADQERPSGEEMLARLRADQPGERGRLRVYMGMAPGVGKTYRMLEEAHRRRDRGTDVVVGFVETYGRRNTAALLDGLEIVPRARIVYRGVVVEEMDTQAVIDRHPAVALVDELAHTNVPGSPREKRWQDVELILDAGIHVISTCNVQHVESASEAVETILGVPVHERVPDAVIRAAEEIELVDMSPHALRQRMRHGNVYPPDRAAIALERYFTEPNLTALRDLSLRFVAGQVDEQLEGIVGEQGIRHLSAVSERVLVVLDGTPACRRAVRRAAALSGALHAPLLAAAVETPTVRMSRDRQQDLQENVDYAVDLGAEIVRLEAPDLVSGLEAIARSRRVAHVVLAQEARPAFERVIRQSVAERLLQRLPGVEIHLIAAEPPEATNPQRSTTR